jgi:hypothetical protein
MKKINTHFLAVLLGGLLAAGTLSAGTVTLANLPDLNNGSGPVQRNDVLTITLDPTDGSGVGTVVGLPGTTVAWGYAASLSSNAGDWLVITSIDFDGFQTNGTFTGGNSFDLGPVDKTGTAGSYAIASTAVVGASDIGNLVFNFDIYDGDPNTVGNQLDSQSYSLPAAVQVDIPVDTGATPEPATWSTLAAGAALLAFRARRARASGRN